MSKKRSAGNALLDWLTKKNKEDNLNLSETSQLSTLSTDTVTVIPSSSTSEIQDRPLNSDVDAAASASTIFSTNETANITTAADDLSLQKILATTTSDGESEVSAGPCHIGLPAPQILSSRKLYFQKDWYNEFPWLDFKNAKEAVFCFVCLEAETKKLFLPSSKINPAFTKHGFRNWKKGKEKFTEHQNSDQHKEAVCALESLQKPKSIVNDLVSSIDDTQRQNRTALEAICSSLRFLAKQGLPIDGTDDKTGNFMELLKLRSAELPILKTWNERSKSFTSHPIRNEICEIMALKILRALASEICASGVYSLIVDETTDISTKEQLSITVRYVQDDLVPVEKFLGLYEVESTTGEMLSTVIMDVLKRFNFSVKMIRGQCYDGAANMKGKFKGVQARILEMEPRALYMHCFNHSLNLALQDTVKNVKSFRDVLQYVNDVSVLINRSPKRMALFKDIAAELSEESFVTLKALCPTRWCVRIASLKAVLKNYSTILVMLQKLADSNDECSGHASGLLHHFEKSETLFTIMLCIQLFEPCERLAKILQSPDQTLSGSIELSDMVRDQLASMKNINSYEVLWSKVKAKANEMDLTEFSLPCKRKVPSRYKDILSCSAPSTSVEEHFRKIYEDSIDLLVNEIQSRFSQPGLVEYARLENIFTESNEAYIDECRDILEKYDFDFDAVKSQLSMFRRIKGIHSLKKTVEQFRSCSADAQKMLSDLKELLKLLLVIPSSTASAERSFSLLRRLKTYLRSTMTQGRLNHLAVLQVYKEEVEALDMQEIMNEFINRKPFRVTQFGKL